MKNKKAILTITGSDSTGGSGVQADILTISELGGVAVSAITSITVQNTIGIQEFYDVPAEIVKGQIEAIINDVQPSVVKVGLIRNVAVLDVIVDMLRRYKSEYVIYDPIFVSSKGERLIGDDVVAQINSKLVPLCTLVVHENLSSSHGEHNAYSSAVAVFLSQGIDLQQAQSKALRYVQNKLLREQNLQGRANELYHDFLRRVAESHERKSDVAYYADSMNVSSRYLAQVCKRVGDKSPKQIIDEYLMNRIEHLLKTTDRTIQEIAYETGFTSQAHLSKFFKNIKGISPSEYRKIQ